jgi:hypothetical protein
MYDFTQVFYFDTDYIHILDPNTGLLYYYNEFTDPIVDGYIGYDVVIISDYPWEGIDFKAQK